MDQIINQLTSPVVLLVGGCLFVFFIIFVLMRSASKSKDPEGDFRDRVRIMVENNDFRGAANLQRHHGNHKEAFNLLERGRLHMEAAKLAEGQKWYDKAAKCAMQAGQFEWAAELLLKSNNYSEAAKMFARVGKHLRAAEMLEQVGTDDWNLLASCWEKALLQMLPSDQDMSRIGHEIARKISLIAEKAAEAYIRAGNPNRAALIYDACQQKAKADTIRQRSAAGTLESMAQLSGAGGGSMDQLAAAAGQPTSTSAGGNTDLSLDEGNLGLLSKVVDQAVNRAIDTRQGTQSQVLMSNHPMTGAMLDGTGGPHATNVHVIYVPQMNAVTGEATATPIRADSERYEIGDKLGEGGMAVVYKAFDKILEREVALKFLPEGVTQAASTYDLFEREAKSAAGINHPNIITIYDFGTLDNRPFICMELLDGISLDDLLQKLPNNRVPLNAFFELFEELLAALETAHGRGLVHRDVKPSNMMLTRQKLLKLMDFGIAKEIDPDKSTMIAGTPYYMAPEQFSGKGIDHRADVFAVGVTMYLCLTGKLPFEGFMRVEPPRPPSELWRLPTTLDKVVMWCMAFEPEKRPQSSYDLLQNLRRIHRELKRDPMWASQLDPEGKEAYVPMLGSEFFKKFETHRHASIRKGMEESKRRAQEQEQRDSSATIAAYEQTSLGGPGSHPDMPSAAQYSKPRGPYTGSVSRQDLPQASHYSMDNLPQTMVAPGGHDQTHIAPNVPGMRPPTRPPGARPPTGRPPGQYTGGHSQVGGTRPPGARPPTRPPGARPPTRPPGARPPTRRPPGQYTGGHPNVPPPDYDQTYVVAEDGESTMVDRGAAIPQDPRRAPQHPRDYYDKK